VVSERGPVAAAQSLELAAQGVFGALVDVLHGRMDVVPDHALRFGVTAVAAFYVMGATRTRMAGCNA
jgi:hypothetical protein